MIHFFAFAAAFFACFVYSFLVGGRPERCAMFAQLLAFLTTLFFISFRWRYWTGVTIGVALTDVALAIALIVLALRANRYWPIVLAGMQLATVFGHLAKFLSVPLPTAGYAIFVQLWGWPMLFVTALGTYKHYQRTKGDGAEQDWKPLWPNSARPEFTV